MNNTTGRRRTNPADPTAEPTADPVPEGEDIIARDETGRDTTPRRFDEVDEPALPSDDATLKTQI
jgi:hypothetical protein